MDLDTTARGSDSWSGRVHVDVDETTETVTFTWDRVGRSPVDGSVPFSFQLQLTDLGNTGVGITFRYGDMELDTFADSATIGFAVLYYRYHTDYPGPRGYYAETSTFLEDTAVPADFDTTPGNTGIPGVWEYVRGDPTITGTPDDDVFTGSNRNDEILGLDGDDTIYGLRGDDRLAGGAGDDALFGAGGDDILVGGAGADRLNGGAGNDTVDYSASDASDGAILVVDLADRDRNTGDAAGDIFVWIENLIGGPEGENNLSGDGGDTTIRGLGENDTIAGRDGDDVLYGNSGNDLLDGGIGDDTLAGGLGSDVMRGGAGADSLTGRDGYDTLDGGAGNESLFGNVGNDTLLGGLGTATLKEALVPTTYAGRTAMT